MVGLQSRYLIWTLIKRVVTKYWVLIDQIPIVGQNFLVESRFLFRCCFSGSFYTIENSYCSCTWHNVFHRFHVHCLGSTLQRSPATPNLGSDANVCRGLGFERQPDLLSKKLHSLPCSDGIDGRKTSHTMYHNVLWRWNSMVMFHGRSLCIHWWPHIPEIRHAYRLIRENTLVIRSLVEVFFVSVYIDPSQSSRIFFLLPWGAGKQLGFLDIHRYPFAFEHILYAIIRYIDPHSFGKTTYNQFLF